MFEITICCSVFDSFRSTAFLSYTMFSFTLAKNGRL